MRGATQNIHSCSSAHPPTKSAGPVLRAGLGKVRDGDYVDYFAKVKRREWQQAHEQITQWELDRYLQLF